MASSKIKILNNTTSLHTENSLSTLEKIGGILCKICDESFKHKKHMDEHFSLHHKSQNIVYTCIICSKEFLNYKVFHDHCYRHSLTKKLACKICNKKFSSRQSLKLHIDIHKDQKDNNDNPSTYDCKRCGKHFTKFTDLLNHSRHCGQQFNCSVCNKIFTHKSVMLRHALCHTEQRNFKCEMCCSIFKTKRDLFRHSKRHRENDSKYKCGICSRTFITSTKLKDHINTHNGHKPFHCEHCDATFTNNPNRIKHIKRAHITQCCHSNLTLIDRINDKKSTDLNDKSNNAENIEIQGTIVINNGLEEYACSECPMLLSCRRSWLRHVKRSHLNFKYRCESCLKIVVFPKPIQHYDTVQSLDSVKPFICDYCGAGFTDKCNLERHMIRSAHLKLDFKCEECDKTFFSSSQLDVHKKCHENRKIIKSVLPLTRKKKGLPEVFPCQCCDKSFSYHWSRVRHMRNEHGKKYDRTLNPKDKGNDGKKKTVTIPNKQRDALQMFTNGSAILNTIPLKEIDVREQIINQNVNEQNNIALHSYSENSLSEFEVKNSHQISLNQSIPHLASIDNESDIDEIDNDLLNYFDSYINGQVDVDILKDTIDIPECTDDCVNLDNISPDFTLTSMTPVSPMKIIKTSPANENILQQNGYFESDGNQDSSKANNEISQNEVFTFGSQADYLGNNMNNEINKKPFYNIKIVKTEPQGSSPKKLLLQINPLFDAKETADQNNIPNSLFYNICDSNQNFYHTMSNNVETDHKLCNIPNNILKKEFKIEFSM